ncbi:MAG TPA: adenylyltransferase/cytidyltransferase family protein [Nitrososphaerales archaeon]|nr:adenylyltransferase/cytidyltransferase family protein [Nitrososphaerales archaeon]
MQQKKTLGAIYAQGLVEGRATKAGLAKALNLDSDELAGRLAALRKRGLISIAGERVRLTEKGRKSIKVVFIGGGFEVIHSGHLHTVGEAKRLGDVLVVVVARDDTIRRRKGREPVSSESERVDLLAALRQVDAAILGGTGDIYEALEKVKPDVVALGYDQYHNVGDVGKEAERRGLKLSVVRLGSPRPSIKTTKILQET